MKNRHPYIMSTILSTAGGSGGVDGEYLKLACGHSAVRTFQLRGQYQKARCYTCAWEKETGRKADKETNERLNWTAR